MTVLLLVALMFTLPHLLSCSRLDVDRLDQTLAAMKQQLIFRPPGGPRHYDTDTAAPLHFDEAGTTTGTADAIVALLFPFAVRSLLPLLPLLSLCWVVLLCWSALHTPFAPPLPQTIFISGYGLQLLLVSPGASSPTAFANLTSLASVFCLLLLPHALANILFAVHLLLDRLEGASGEQAYERRIERERAQWQRQQQPQQRPISNGQATLSTLAQKKRK